MIKIRNQLIDRSDIVEIGKNVDESYFVKIKRINKYEQLMFDAEVIEINNRQLFVKSFKLNLEYNEITIYATTNKQIDLTWLHYATIDSEEIISRIKDLFFEFAVEVNVIETKEEDERK